MVGQKCECGQTPAARGTFCCLSLFVTQKHWRVVKHGLWLFPSGMFSFNATLWITCSRSVSVECNLLCNWGCVVRAVGTAGAHGLLGRKS